MILQNKEVFIECSKASSVSTVFLGFFLRNRINYGVSWSRETGVLKEETGKKNSYATETWLKKEKHITGQQEDGGKVGFILTMAIC